MGRRSVRGIEVPKAFAHSSGTAEAWVAGYEHGLSQCNHHPEAMTNAAVDAIVANERRKNDTAFNEGHTQGRRDESNDKMLTTKALKVEFQRGKNYGYNDGYEAGVKEGHKQTHEHANQWLMEAFVLFMQEQGAEAAAMTLVQMHELRHKVNELDQVLSSIEEPR